MAGGIFVGPVRHLSWILYPSTGVSGSRDWLLRWLPFCGGLSTDNAVQVQRFVQRLFCC